MTSLVSLYSPRIVSLPSTASVPQEVHYWAHQTVGAINAFPPFSQFSWADPNSHETAQARTLGINLASASVASTLWLKKFGSSTTGWIAIA